jgi:cytochrome c oxidase cbb3-type subunit 2
MMKNGFLFFIGLLAAFAFGWAGIALGSHGQLGSLTAYFDTNAEAAYPTRPPGLANRGQLVYADLGCAACHTQQVRRPDFGSDKDRGWGERQSVARDYIFQVRPQIGESRVGPDLANYGARLGTTPEEIQAKTGAIAEFLYTGILPGGKEITHPPYKFLFEDRKQVGERSDFALPASISTTGHQVIASERARTLIAYLQSLNSPYAYPEAKPAVIAAAPEKKEEGHK